MQSRFRYGNEAIIAAELAEIDNTTLETLKAAGRTVLRFSGSLASLAETGDFKTLMSDYGVEWEDPDTGDGGPKYIVIKNPSQLEGEKVQLLATELLHLASKQEVINPDGTLFIDYTNSSEGEVLAELD